MTARTCHPAPATARRPPSGRAGRLRPLCLGLLAAGVLTLGSGESRAGALTDGSVGPVRSLSGQFVVPPTLGTVRGSNLFHSFQRFGITLGESATFQSPDAALRNVIVRVTGNEATRIDGPLTLSAPGGARPALWFMNPNGISVGPGGVFDVPGSLRLATAHSLQFADGSSWSTSTAAGDTSTLSVADPRAFGFLPGAPAAPLQWTGTGSASGVVSARVGGDLELSAGRLTLDGAVLQTTAGGITLTAQAELNVLNDSLVFASFAGTQPQRGPNIQLRAGPLLIDGSAVVAQTDGPTGTVGAGIQIQARSLALLNAAQLGTYALNAGDAGRIDIQVDSVRLDGGTAGYAALESIGYGALAAAGRVSVQAQGDVDLVNGGYVLVGTAGNGGLGLIRVSSQRLSIDGSSSGLFAEGRAADSGGTGGLGAPGVGSGARIELDTRDTLRVDHGGWINSYTYNEQAGGAIDIRAGAVLIDHNGSVQANSAGQGAGGDVSLTVQGALQVLGGSFISTDASGPARSGSITLQADSLLLAGRGSRFSAESNGGGSGDVLAVATRAITLRDGAQISVNAQGGGAGGGIGLDAPTLQVLGGATLNSSTSGTGDAGAIVLTAQVLDVTGGSKVETRSTGSGRAGAIAFSGERITLNQASVSADAGPASRGAASAIDLGDTRTRSLNISQSQVSTSTAGAAFAGTITLQADTVRVDLGSTLQTQSSGSGEAGIVDVQGRQITISQSSVLAEAGAPSTGTAGVITLGTDGGTQSLTLDRATVSVDTAGAASDGALTLGGASVRVQGSTLRARTAGPGTGGTLSILGDDIGLATSTVSTESARAAGSNAGSAGNAGDLQIGRADGSTRTLNISGSQVRSDTTGSGHAGFIRLNGETLGVDGGSRIASVSTGSGEAGLVRLDGRTITLSNASIATDAGALSEGTAGYVLLGNDQTRTLTLRQGSSVSSTTAGTAAEGVVTLRADAIDIREASRVDASTRGLAQAGDVTLTARTLSVSGGSTVSSSATATSEADAGKVRVQVSGAVDIRQSRLLAVNDTAELRENPADASGVYLEAGSLNLDRGQILASATDGANGGTVSLQVAGATTLLNGSRIGTSANIGDGGPVSLTSGGRLLLRDSQITTSVDSVDYGSGGNIAIQAPVLLMRSGFVQANTRAQEFEGGNVSVRTGLLLPDGSNLRLGGRWVETFRDGGVAGYNVIQAAAPDGVSGQLSVIQPELNVAAALAALSAPRLGVERLSVDLCEAPGRSSLTVLTRGVLYPYASAPLDGRR